ncbi:MAG TPA: rhomboid family intramembrane serine protease [Gemmataceae bacterium]|jgi:membrane associated rhomboid family serine protease|nr:rhomboid family intramembrane serine protease [Gemmataceae bacterium]
MIAPDSDPLEAILRHCAASAPEPWYPKVFSETTGVSRESLDPHLDKLRLDGFIQLTPWEMGTGQGYALTPDGVEILKNPRDLQRLKDGKPVSRPASPNKPAQANGAAMTSWERGEMVRDTLLSTPNPMVTRLLFAANILVFVYGMFLASQQGLELNKYVMGSQGLFGGQALNGGQDVIYQKVLTQSGAVNGANLVNGQWWRLITCCFVHIGLLHLGVNMLALYRAGPLIEQMWGHLRFFWIYLLSGLGGSCLALRLSSNGIAGASGALCGIFAALALWIVLFRKSLPPQLLSSWYRVLGINLVLIVFISLMPGVSGAGHLGGAVVGVVTGLLLHVHRFNKSLLGWLALFGTLILPIVGVAAVIIHYSAPVSAKSDLTNARHAENGTRLVMQQFVYPLLESPIHRVLPDDPEATEMAFSRIQEAVARLSDSRAELTTYLDRLKNRGLITSLPWNAEDKAALDEVIYEAAIYSMVDLYLRTERDARVAFEKYAKLWIMRHPSRRDPPDVKKSIEGLAQEQEKVNSVVEEFTKAGPYPNSRTEDVRKTLENLVNKWGVFLERVVQHLDKQENHEDRLNSTISDINKLRKRVVQLCVAK